MNLYLNDFKEIIYRTKNKNIIFQAIEFDKDNNYKVLDEINTHL